MPRGAGLSATALLLVASLAYGAVKGGHIPTIVGQLKSARDGAANAVGFGITSIAIEGRRAMSEGDVLSAAGITARDSLLFLDLEAARARLTANPWIADATLRKFYPGKLQIEIAERIPFALWQKAGKVFVIAADGTVLGPLVDRRMLTLPLVVGAGAEAKARGFLTVLEKYPAIREQVRASILIAERRWTVRLKNGIDVRLPDSDVERALETLAGLDRDKKLLSRDIATVDLRLPDRVTVRLTDAAAQAREDALKKRTPKRKGGDA